MKTDLIVTTTDRPELLRQMLDSLCKTTPKDQYRLTIVVDGFDADTVTLFNGYGDLIDQTIISERNEGLGPSLNKAIALVGALKSWDDGAVPLTCYVQDDVVFARDWLATLTGKFLQLERPLGLAFASGHSAVEHYDDPRAQRKDLGGGMYVSKYIRATCMLARHETWRSMIPIPRVDPETGRERGRPHNGMGSGVDWHFVRVHDNSVVRTNRTNLVIPGLVVHAGYDKSTWLNRELPESEADKAAIK